MIPNVGFGMILFELYPAEKITRVQIGKVLLPDVQSVGSRLGTR
jgi:hypothetical protein